MGIGNIGGALLKNGNMGHIYLCFSLKSVSSSMISFENLDTNYQTIYKPLLKFLFSHPDFPFSFSFNGFQIQYFKKRKNELISIIKQMVERNQVEIFGGGYYSPILPLLYPVDRNGQIDLLSAEIKQTFGKRPRGMSLFADCWDSSLVNNVHTCGLDYVVLDSFLIPENKLQFLPIIMTDLNKTVDIFPYFDEFLPSKDITPEEFLNKIIKKVEKIIRKDNHFQLDVDRIININLSHKNILELLESKWFENFFQYVTQEFPKENQNYNIHLSTPNEYRKNVKVKVPAYITTGINGSVAKWINNAYIKSTSHQKTNYTVFDFFDTYNSSRALYNRIIYVSMLVNQYKNDKMRKKAAREKLWEAQNGTSLLCSSEGAFFNSKYRHQSYKLLMEVEKILREDGHFEESVTCFDYNNDGLKEYVCRMENYFAYISLISGAIQELEILKNTGNYADNQSRILEYDGVQDDYERGLFVDHFFSDDQFEKYIKNEPAGDGVFSRIQYEEIKYSQSHHEIQLGAKAIWKPGNQKIYIRKKYIINSDGMYVQYIIKNESEKNLHAKFAVEMNIANTDFDEENITYNSIELVDNGEKFCPENNNTYEFLKNNKLKNVAVARISDTDSGTSFVFEPNENCGFCYNPIIFKRQNVSDGEIVPADLTNVSTLFWDINLEPKMETEKSINFTIIPYKKKRK